MNPWQLGGFGAFAGPAFVLNPQLPPTARITGLSQVNEGALASFSGADSTDPDGDSLTYAWDFGDGATASGQDVTHVYKENGTYTITLTVTDIHEATGSTTLTVTVNNLPATVNAGQNQTALEGSIVSLVSATFVDPGILDTHTATINWGDGTVSESGAVVETNGSGSVSGSHVYADNGIYPVTVCVTDDEGATGCSDFSVSVENVAPSVNAGSNQVADEGSVVSVSSTFNDKGTKDTHAATINWGDGTTNSGTVTGSPFGPPGSTAGANGSVSGSHVYADNGSHAYPVDSERPHA